MVTYLKRDVKGNYVEFPEALDPELYDNLGTTYQDYKDGKWIQLSDEQLAFHSENPKASVEGVINMALNPRTVSQARRAKNQQLSDYYYSNYNKLSIDDENIWISRSERMNKRVEINRKKEIGETQVAIGSKTFDINLANQVLDLIDAQETACQSWLTQKQFEINSSEDVEEIDAIVVNEGIPSGNSYTTEELKKLDEKEEKTSVNRQLVSFMKLNVNTLVADMDDQVSLSIKSLYPEWLGKGAEEGKQVEVGFKLTSDGDLYKVRQAHTISSAWKPGIDTASIYERIDEVHEGTIEDPIPYEGNMRLELGKYYTEDGILYKCIRDSEIAVFDTLANLSTVQGGSYVEVVNQ